MKYTAVIGGEDLEIELSGITSARIEASVGGRKYVVEAKAVRPGVYWFHWNGRSIDISVNPVGDAYLVSLSGQRLAVEMVDARTALRKAARQGQAGAVELRAPMPGKLVKVLVAEGDEVQSNQGLLVMEAMKMQNEIRSPKKGIVRKLGVTQGAAVNAGDLLAIVD